MKRKRRCLCRNHITRGHQYLCGGILLKQILEKHIVNEEYFQAMQEENYNKFLETRAEYVKQMFVDMGLNIKFVEKNQIDEQLDDEDLEATDEQ